MKNTTLHLKPLLLLAILAIPHEVQGRTVTILSQWHLLPSKMTQNVDESKKLPQYPNQKAIYMILDEWIQQSKLDMIVAEGCEGGIDQNFKTNYNGWSYSSLVSSVISPSYPDILTLVPLKIEAKFKDGIQTVCGDKNKLIKEHELIMSDLRGLSGFLVRMQEAKKTGDTEKYDAYKQTYEEISGKRFGDPIGYIKERILELIEEEKKILEKRNKAFFEKVSKSKSKSAAVVIGHRHTEHLKGLFKMAGYTVITPSILDDTLPKVDPMTELKGLAN